MTRMQHQFPGSAGLQISLEFTFPRTKERAPGLLLLTRCQGLKTSYTTRRGKVFCQRQLQRAEKRSHEDLNGSLLRKLPPTVICRLFCRRSCEAEQIIWKTQSKC